jgi:hypothetical protein
MWSGDLKLQYKQLATDESNHKTYTLRYMAKYWGPEYMHACNGQYIEKRNKEEVLGRTNNLLSFDTTLTA